MNAEELEMINETKRKIINSGCGVFQISLRQNDYENQLMPKTIFPCKIKLSSDRDYEYDLQIMKYVLMQGESIYVEWEETEENLRCGTLDRWRVASIEGPFALPTMDELLSVQDAADIWGIGKRTIRQLENNDGMVSKFEMMKYFGALQSLPIHYRRHFRIMVKDYRRAGIIYRDMRLKDWIDEREQFQLLVYNRPLK